MDLEKIEELELLMEFFIEVGNSISGKKINGQDGLKYAETIGKKHFHIFLLHII
jgi:hypothetical protein